MQSVKFNYTFAYVYDHMRDVLDYDHSYELNTISSKLRWESHNLQCAYICGFKINN